MIKTYSRTCFIKREFKERVGTVNGEHIARVGASIAAEAGLEAVADLAGWTEACVAVVLCALLTSGAVDTQVGPVDAFRRDSDDSRISLE